MTDGKDLYRPIKIAPKKDRLKIEKQMYDSRGGTIEPLPPHDKPTIQDKHIVPSAVYCSQCDNWHNGKGSQNCLKCGKYKTFQKKSVLRDAIVYKNMPDEILESFEELPKVKNIVDAIKQLPIDKSVPLMMYYLLGCTLQEIADYHKVSAPAIHKKNKLSIELIKQTVSHG